MSANYHGSPNSQPIKADSRALEGVRRTRATATELS